MALEVDKLTFNISELKKCGEVSTLLSIGKNEFFLNCLFCEFSYIQLNNFIQHVYDEHLSEFPDIDLKNEAQETSLELEKNPEEDVISTHSKDVDKGDENGGYVLHDFERIEVELDPSDADSFADTNYQTHDDVENNLSIYNNESSLPKLADDDYILPESHESVEQFHFEKRYSEERESSEGPVDIDIKIEEVEISNQSEINGTDKKQDESKTYHKKKKVRNIISILDPAQCITLAEIYKAHPCLWNEKEIAYRFRNRRIEALRNVWKEFNKQTALNLTQVDLEREIVRLRKVCSNEKKQKIHCKHNQLDYATTCRYYDHIAFLEDDVAPFECSICGKLHPGLGQLKVHLASHDGSLPFKCHLCGHGFQLGTNLTVHLRRHAQDYTYNCKVCGKTCATTTEVKIHMRTHTGETPFVCSICGSKFKTSSQMLTHTMRHEKRPRHKCKICSRHFYAASALTEHMMVHSKVRDIICDVCNKGFKSKKQLRQHKLIHDEEKKYICKFCGKRFAQSAGLCGHMKSHGEKLSLIASAKNIEMENQKS